MQNKIGKIYYDAILDRLTFDFNKSLTLFVLCDSIANNVQFLIACQLSFLD